MFDQADDFDLIHNHAGFGPGTYARLVNRPMLTTLHETRVRPITHFSKVQRHNLLRWGQQCAAMAGVDL